MASASGDYQFSAEPKEVRAMTQKYREPSELQPAAPSNIMQDKRVVRGNTYAQMVIPASTQQEMERQQELEEKRKLRSEQRRMQESEQMQREISTPEPVEDRKHIDVQTENFIEELTDKPPEYEIETQTEFNIDRPPTPLFVPVKIGDDVETQVEDGELFCFNDEVDPILRVLVGKTLESSRMEVLEEEELREMRRHQREFEQKRDAELIEVQRLEEEERRRKEEADKRKKQMRERKEQLQFAHQKYCCRIYSKRYLSKLKKSSLLVMRDLGTFRPPQEMAFHDQLLPWIASNVVNRIGDKRNLEDLFIEIVGDGCQKITTVHAGSVKTEKDRLEAIRQEGIRVARETEERKATRVEMRAKRKAWKEKMELKERIQQNILDLGAKKEGISTLEISEFDAETSDPIICTPGGFFVEFIVLLQSMEIVNGGDELTVEQIRSLLIHFITTYFKEGQTLNLSQVNKTAWDAFVRKDILLIEDPEPVEPAEGEPPAEPVEPAEDDHPELEFKTDSFHELTEPQWESIEEFVRNPEIYNPESTLAQVWNDREHYNMRKGLIEDLMQAVVQILEMKEEDEGFAAKESIKFNPSVPEPAETEKSAVVRIIIPLNREVVTEPQEDEEKGSEEESETPRETPIEKTPEPEERVPTPEPVKPYLQVEVEENFPEHDTEDQILAIPTMIGDLNVYVLHQHGQRVVRKDMVTALKGLKDYEHLTQELLSENQIEIAEQVESRVLAKVASELPVFKFELN